MGYRQQCTDITPILGGGTERVCWLVPDGSDVYQPHGFEDEATGADPTGFSFGLDPSGTGSVVMPGIEGEPEAPTIDLKAGWNGGGFSIGELASDWQGVVSFDIPDVLGSRPGGVAIGFAPIENLPLLGRNGFGHLRYGIVFTAETVRIIHGGAIVLTVAYPSIRADRIGGDPTDQVQALMYGQSLKWVVNGKPQLAGPFNMVSEYALDATLYTAFDAVDNPKFTAGDWSEDIDVDSLTGILPMFVMTSDATLDDELVASFKPFTGRFSEEDICELIGTFPPFSFIAGQGDSLTGNLGAFTVRMADTVDFEYIEGRFGGFTAFLAMTGPDDESVPFSALTGFSPRFTMVMDAPPDITLLGTLGAFYMRMVEDTSGMELVGKFPGFKFVAYGGEMTPLVQITETMVAVADILPNIYISVSFIERMDGTLSLAAMATITADASEHLEAQDQIDVMATMLDSIIEQLGIGERLITNIYRLDGSFVDGGQAWVVNTDTSATTRYDTYGFNSFFRLGEKHYGVRPSGVFLLEGDADAGRSIESGVSLGKHDFGARELKHIDAVYVGVSATGQIFLKIGDGQKEYTYQARRVDEATKVQRFDPGRGLRANYFTFDLTSSDSFELDNISFHVLPTQRKI